jgi:hypothetical protein
MYICSFFLEIYLTHFRSLAVHRSGNTASLESPKSPLFIDFNGSAITDFGRYLTAFFVKKCDLHITSTTLREFAETTSHEKFHKGLITEGQKRSITRTG